MGFYVKTGLGIALFLGSTILFNVQLIALLETGTCASGNTPYEIARPCPEGTGTDVLLLVASIFGALTGMVLYALRGRSPGGNARDTFFASAGGGVAAWGIFFTATGATSLIHSLSSDTIGPDGELGGAIVGVTFLLMGLPALALLAWGLRNRRREKESAGGTAQL